MKFRYHQLRHQINFPVTPHTTKLSNFTTDQQDRFNSHLRSLINSLPPFPFQPRPTYCPKVDTLLDQITPFLHELSLQRDTQTSSVTNRLLKLATFQLHRHRTSLDRDNLYLGVVEKPSNTSIRFTTYTRMEECFVNIIYFDNNFCFVLGKLDQILSLIGWGCYPKGTGVRILALDGGGSRGLVALHLLSAIEQRTGRKLRDMFDLVYGTSTGAIIIFLHFLCKIELPECVRLYQKFRSVIYRITHILS